MIVSTDALYQHDRVDAWRRCNVPFSVEWCRVLSERLNLYHCTRKNNNIPCTASLEPSKGSCDRTNPACGPVDTEMKLYPCIFLSHLSHVPSPSCENPRTSQGIWQSARVQQVAHRMSHWTAQPLSTSDPTQTEYTPSFRHGETTCCRITTSYKCRGQNSKRLLWFPGSRVKRLEQNRQHTVPIYIYQC